MSASEDAALSDYDEKLRLHLRGQRLWFQAKGRGEGRVFAGVRAVMMILETRRLAISEEQKARIRACTDYALLEEWIAKAVTVASTEEVFARRDDEDAACSSYL